MDRRKSVQGMDEKGGIWGADGGGMLGYFRRELRGGGESDGRAVRIY